MSGKKNTRWLCASSKHIFRYGKRGLKNFRRNGAKVVNKKKPCPVLYGSGHRSRSGLSSVLRILFMCVCYTCPQVVPDPRQGERRRSARRTGVDAEIDSDRVAGRVAQPHAAIPKTGPTLRLKHAKTNSTNPPPLPRNHRHPIPTKSFSSGIYVQHTWCTTVNSRPLPARAVLFVLTLQAHRIHTLFFTIRKYTYTSL
jgi:hypothetical protein